MDFDDAKENIQPLATGRNATILQASITHSSQELLEQRRELEAGIHAYNGDDPLEPWYNYISWIEQSFPSGGKESGLMQVLSKCLRRFESEEQYYQDRRMIKLFIKFLDSHKDSTECYQQLYNAGIGTMVSDFYIAWAYCYDSIGQMRKADEVFRRGIECRAQPLDELKEAHQHFGLSVAQRTIYKDDEDALLNTNRQIEERRSALSSLRGYRSRTGKSEIGSIRTGVAIKSHKPGTIQHDSSIRGGSSSSNARVTVLVDENVNPNMNVEMDEPKNEESQQSNEFQSATVVRSIVDKARHQENEREPGPWNKVHDKKNAKKLMLQKKVIHNLGFDIHEDKDEDENSVKISDQFEQIIIPDTAHNYNKPFKYPENFVSKNSLQPEWILPVTTECQPDLHTLPRYNKCMIYPRPNREFQSEELRGYIYFKKRNIQNAFTQRYSAVWGNDITVPIRLYPNFARESKPQIPNELDSFFAPCTENGVYMVPLEKLYNVEKKEEFQNEELMVCHLRSVNETVMAIEDMDETMCANSNNEQVQRRKSFFPTRRSLAIRSVITRKDEGSCADSTESQTTFAQGTESKISTETKKERVLPTHLEINSPIDKLEDLAITNQSKEVEQEAILPTGSKLIFDDFQFKTPALPIKPVNHSPEILEIDAQNQIQPINKLPFEIYVDENAKKVDHGIFDAEETCSTQQFNNFIKSQSVSTPKATQKTQKRQFGVLLDVPLLTPNPAPLEITSPTEATIEAADVVVAVDEPISNSPSLPDVQVDVPANPYSPQLSTIFEASEHVSHSTGASTKSTNGSRESDFADVVVNSAVNAAPPVTTNTYNTVKETSCHSMKDVVELMRDVHLTVSMSERATVSTTQPQLTENSASPVVAKKFLIYEDETETFPQLPKDAFVKVTAGNFERMVEREDTGTGCYAVHSSLRFQDDKTETVTKLVVPCAFPDDRTGTISKAHDSMFTYEQQARTTTALLAPPISSTFLETTQHHEKSANSPKKTPMISSSAITSMENLHLEDDDEDSFEFFRKSPLKTQKTSTKSNFYHLPRETEPTPSKAPDTKRFCVQQTPKEMLKKSSRCVEKNNSQMEFMKFFENEMVNIDNGENAAKYTHGSEKYAVEFFPERASTISGNIPKNSISNTKNENKIKIVESEKNLMHNSQADEGHFKLDVTKQVNTQDNELKNDSFLPELMPTKKSTHRPLTPIDMSGFSFIKNTSQPNTETIFKSQPNTCSTNTQGSIININGNKSKNIQTAEQKSILKFRDSFLPEKSLIEETQPTIESLVKSKQKTPLIMTPFEKLCPQAQEKRISSSHIPKRIFQNTKKNLMESTTTQSSVQTLKQTESQKSGFTSIITNDTSFIPETQEFQTNSSSSSTQTRLTKTNFSRNTLIPTSKNDGNCSISTSKEVSQLLTSSAVTSHNNLKTIEKSKEDYANNSISNSNRAPIFELNAETEMFSTGISMIKNSTMVSRSSLKSSPAPTPLKHMEKDHSLTSITKSNQNKSEIQHEATRSHTLLDTEQDRSIYFKNTPRTPVLKIHNKSWSCDEEYGAENTYLHHDVDLNETNQRIHSICEDEHVNPFNADLLTALLDQIEFVNYLNDLKNTMLVGRVPRLKANLQFAINNMEFSVSKLIGEGAYGTIYCGVEKKSGKQYAFKQERPPNYWEYYICLEVQSRVTNEEILSAYMNIDYALIGNNASILISPFSPYGSIISVCNKIKKQTLKNVDEYVVMHLTCELLEIIDHLHATSIIHADVKADNFLLMKKLTYNSRQLSLQLIDFGVSIDMKHFKENQTFTYIHNDNAFKCVEMRENRPWTYQLDLYGLAGVIHVMLFGKYMDIEKRADKWLPKTHMPRYINKLLWESIFRTLLNVRDCRSMPNLQQLRVMIKEEMAEKETYVINKIVEFNKALTA